MNSTEETATTSGASAQPVGNTGQRLISFNGRALDAEGSPVTELAGVTFAVYAEQSGGAPLWLETQNLATDANGRFSAKLGAASRTGIPSDLFSSGEARWLGVLTHSPGVSEQPRVLLVNVPEAPRFADSELLGGKPSAAYVTAGSPVAETQTAAPTAFSATGTGPMTIAPIAPNPPHCFVQAVSAPSSAAAGYLPVFSNSSGSLANSVVAQANGNIGIGIVTPSQTLSFGGGTARSVGVEANPNTGAAGSDLSIAAGAPGAGAFDQKGGNLILSSGNGTGAGGGGNLHLQAAGDGVSGNSADTVSDRLLIAGKAKQMTGTVPTANLFSLHIPTGEAAGGKVKFTIVASDGTNYAMETGEMIYLANPKQITCAVVISEYAKAPPAYTNTVLAVPAIGQTGSLNAQCSTATFAGDPGVQIFDTAPTSFTATTHKVYYTIENQSQAVITLQE